MRNLMTGLKRRLCSAACTAALFALGGSLVGAQSYPVKPIRMVVPYPAGGVNDIIARILAQKMSETLGQSVVIDNRAGAGGNIGTDFVAKAPPDGYTLLSGGVGSLVMNPILEKVPYDTARDFAPVILMATSPNVLAVHPSLPLRSVKQLIALAKSRPGELNYASGGTGSTPHLSGALFASMAGINIVHVPYKGMTPGTTALISGEVQLNFLGIPPALPHLAAGRLRALGVTGKVRSSKLPDVPTIAESALPGYEVSPWFGVLAPAGTAPEIVLKLNTEIARMMRSAEMRDKLGANGADAAFTTPEEFSAVIAADTAKWRKLISDAGVRSQ
jgi:tripartite-type tricarboxylate transporter receptor subunit TctC